MTISKELVADILRYYHVEKWRVGTMAKQLGVHHATIKRVLSSHGIPKSDFLTRGSMIDPYLPFIMATLEKFPKVTASRLYAMVQARGYPGGENHFRHLISLYRPKPAAEAYLRLKTLPAEQAQVDWGHFGTLSIGQAKRPLMAFVMVLSYSRKIFLRFYLNQQSANFFRGHVAAFTAWGGVPRVLLYDNLKSAVLERQGQAIRFHPTLLELARHYRFEPRPVAVARGNEKGRVERAIRYVRDNFFAARTFNNLDDLNAQASLWCEGPAAQRPCPENKAFRVKQVFEQESSQLITLPDNPFVTTEHVLVKVGKTPYGRFDGNDYSVPHTHVRKTLTIAASLTHVTVLDAGTIVAKHPRCYDKGQHIEDAQHIKDLIERKRKAKHHWAQNRLTKTLPQAQAFLNAAAQRGYKLTKTSRELLQLLDDYGAAQMQIALTEAMDKQVPHPNAVRIILQRRREQRQQPPPIPLSLPQDPRIQNQAISAPNLQDYGSLQNLNSQENDDE